MVAAKENVIYFAAFTASAFSPSESLAIRVFGEESIAFAHPTAEAASKH